MAEEEKAGKEAAAGEEYESDLDDAPLPAASDDEDEGGGGGGRESPLASTVFDSEFDPDGQGAAELYDDDEEYGIEYGGECEDVHEKLDAGGRGGGGEAEVVTGEVVLAPEDEGKYEEEKEAPVEGELEAAVEGKEETATEEEEGVKKESKPYAVPTRGAFYEHDNRFQVQETDSRGYQRRVFGAQKLWYPKKEAAWVHDRFYEMNSHDAQHDNVSIMHSGDHGHFEGTKSYDDTKNFDNVQIQSHSYYGNAKGNNILRNVYGEKISGTYQCYWTTSGISSAQNNRKSYSRLQNAEVSSNAGVRKHSSQTLSLQHEQTLPCKQTFGSNIREKARRVTFSKLFSSAVHKAHNSLTPHSCPIFRRKAFIPSGELGTAVDSCCIVPTEVMPCSALHSMPTSNNYSKYSKSWDQGRDLNIPEHANNTFCLTVSQATRPYTQPHSAVYQQRSVQPPILPTPKAPAQIFVQEFTSANRIQSLPQTIVVSSDEDGDATTHPEPTPIRSAEDSEATIPSEPNSSVVLSVIKGQDDLKEAERTSFADGGDHVLGVTGAQGFTLGDPDSTATLTKLPVMQFSGQLPRVPGFPSVAMVLPGFVGQQLGGNSEIMGLMTCGALNWFQKAVDNCPFNGQINCKLLPILTDGTGVLEGTCSPPSFDSNCPQPSELASSSVLPRDHGATKDPISSTTQEIPEVVGHELVRRQNRPHRYSEMSFAM